MGLKIGLKYSEIVDMNYNQLTNLLTTYFDRKKVKRKPTQEEIDLIT